MLKFYYSGAPNPMKVALCLEEVGLQYEAIPVDTRKSEQHTPGYLAINPNAKVPAIVDEGTPIFDSNAILLYLAEKTGKFLGPKSGPKRGELLSWMMFVASGIGPLRGDADWQSLAEEVRMQVLQRLDLFTDTGLREQLGARLSPIVERASAQLIETINRELGELVRGYVAEAIEREIESWRSRESE